MITLTQSAARHIQQQLEQRGSGLGLRIGMKKSGCSGFMYFVDYADEIHSDDQVFEQFDTKIITDNESYPFLKGTEVDYVKNNFLSEGFEFNNPQVKNACGCGESVEI